MSKETKNKISIVAKKQWSTSEYRDKHLRNKQSLKQIRSKKSKETWIKYGDKISNSLKIAANTPKALEKRSRISKQLWKDPKFRKKISESMILKWKDDNFRHKIAVTGQPRLSKNWTNDIQINNFNFNESLIKEISKEDCESLLNKYHYLSKLGRSGIYLGSLIDTTLTSTAVFTSPIRIESAIKNKNTVELSRFCINPTFQKKNYAS
jgi:hypothetical protein